jgi:hypothetical protein
MDDDLIQQFCTITEASRETAQHFLEASDLNFESAVELFFAQNSVDQPTTSGSAATDSVEAEVRNPIPQKSDTLVRESFHSSYAPLHRQRTSNSVFDKFRDFEAEAKAHAKALASTSKDKSAADKPEHNSKRQTLEALFRPPVEIMHRGTFETAKEEAIVHNRWLMVNVQNTSEFACQALNRDIWNHSMVQELIKNNFVLWQIYHDTAEGRRFQTYYLIETHPFVGIVDPRTGELVNVLRIVTDAVAFCDAIMCFLESRSEFGGLTNNNLSKVSETKPHSNAETKVDKSKRKRKFMSNDIGDDDDDDISIISDNGPASSKKMTKFNYDESYDPLSNGNSASSTHATSSSPKITKENWMHFCEPIGTQIQVMFRLVNGGKHVLTLSIRSKLKALLLYADTELSLSSNRNDFVLNFPTRILNKEDPNKTLEELQFNKQEVIYVEER